MNNISRLGPLGVAKRRPLLAKRRPLLAKRRPSDIDLSFSFPSYLVTSVTGLPEKPLGPLPPPGRLPNGAFTPFLTLKVNRCQQSIELPPAPSSPLVPVVEDGPLVHGLEVVVGHGPEPETFHVQGILGRSVYL